MRFSKVVYSRPLISIRSLHEAAFRPQMNKSPAYDEPKMNVENTAGRIVGKNQTLSCTPKQETLEEHVSKHSLFCISGQFKIEDQKEQGDRNDPADF